MDKKQNKINIEELVFQYKWWIGSILLTAIILSGGYLFWKEGGRSKETKVAGNKQIAKLEERIQNLEQKNEELELKVNNQTANIKSTETTEQSVATTNDSGIVAGATASNSGKATTPTGKVNLNTATSAELDTLPGIGEAYAARIIEYRTSHGGFKSIDEIKNVKGIGDKTFEKLKDKISI